MQVKRVLKGNASDSLIYAGVRVVTTVIGILTTSILSHGLDLETYGTYSQGNLLVSVITSSTILGFTDGVNFFYNKGGSLDSRRRYVNTLFGIQLIIGILAAICIFVFQNAIYAYFNSDAIRNFLLYLCFRPLLNNYIPMLQVLYVSVGQAKQIAVRNFAISLAKLAGVCLTVFWTQEIQTIFAILFIMDAISVLYFVIGFAKRQFWIKPWKVDYCLIKEIFGFCIPMGIYVMLNSLCRECDKMIVARMGNAEQLAVYSNASLPLPIDIVISSVMTVIIPVITRLYHKKNYSDAAMAFKNYLQIGYLTTFTFGAACVILSSEIIGFLYGSSYLIGESVFIIYLFVDMLKFANISAILSIAGKSRTLAKVGIAMLVLNIPLNILGYWWIGLAGPATATLIITIGSTLLLLNLGRRELEVKFSEILSARAFFRYCIKLFVCISVCYFVRSFISNLDWAPLLTIISVGAIFIVSMMFLNAKDLRRAFVAINHLEES